MLKGKKAPQLPQKILDTFSRTRGRGRPWKVPHPTVIGRAGNYRYIFTQVWPALRGPLIAARNEQEVVQALQETAKPYAHDFVPLASDILYVIRETKFPKRSKAQIGFLADSLAGRPNLEPRTSRDICGEARSTERTKSPHKILRKEFYIECSCGYQGPARDNTCRECGAEIPVSIEELLIR